MKEGISVVIPCYNAAKYVRETLDSVLAQDYDGPLEVLVADDGSTDGSQDIIRSYGPPVYLLEKPPGERSSASIARNRCLKSATQPLVAFLDADDLWLPGHLNSLSQIMKCNPEVGLAYDLSYLGSESGAILEPWDTQPQPATLKADDLLLGSRFGTGSVLVRRCVFDVVGVFDETLRHSEDHDLWLRVAERFLIAHVPNYGFVYRQHGNQKSLKPTLWIEASRVLEKACQRYPYCRSTIRKRRAVLSYRYGQLAARERKMIRALTYFGRAALLDPIRASREIFRRMMVRRKRGLLYGL